MPERRLDKYAILNWIRFVHWIMPSIEAIPLPLPYIGSVNAWLLQGEPLTLLDTGPRSDEALGALEDGLRGRGLRVEDIELVVGTHHHHDHVGLAATIKRRSGAKIAVLDRAADYGSRFSEHVADERRFAGELMREHGMPPELRAPALALWDYIDATSESFTTDVRLADGDTIVAGGRELRVISRPGHSTSDTLFVDPRARVAFIGDHLLSKITPNTEIHPVAGPGSPRSRSRVDYVDGLRLTARRPVERLLTGHGPVITAPAPLIERHFDQHRRRCRRIMRVLERGPASAYAIARHLWSEAIIREQPLLVLWEVLGHLDLLLSAGVAAEQLSVDGGWRYSLARRRPAELRTAGGPRLVHAG